MLTYLLIIYLGHLYRCYVPVLQFIYGCYMLQFETGMEKCKLFVSGLSFNLTKEDLEKEFSKVSAAHIA